MHQALCTGARPAVPYLSANGTGNGTSEHGVLYLPGIPLKSAAAATNGMCMSGRCAPFPTCELSTEHRSGQRGVEGDH